MNKSRLGSLEVAVGWRSPYGQHVDRYHFDKVDFWRDLFPVQLGEDVARLRQGEHATASLDAGELVPPYLTSHLHDLRGGRFRSHLKTGAVIAPRVGRFYPRGLIPGVEDTFPQDRRPFRCIGLGDEHLRVDLNHPLARSPITVEATLVEHLASREEHGGRCNDIVLDAIENGPGLQGALAGVETDFYAGNPFSRLDERDDLEFYQQPRMVHHIDATARARISDIYGRSLKPGMHVLDLMSSWTSHLPDDLHGLSVVGLGMNAEEMKANPRLCSHVVHDLNRDPVLPFSENLFDAAICTVSVEYMTRPIEAMRDLARVLKPAAPLVVTWSERWFPPKVVQVWTELHPFERMGLVIDYFVRSGGFDDIETETIRGLPRPSNDKYANMVPFSDPVYAVWGRCSTHR